MKTRTYTTHRPFKPVLSPRPAGGFFIPDIFPGKIRAELTTELANSLIQKKIINKLTKVNKPAITHLLSITSNSIIFPMVKRPLSIVNRIVVFTTQNL